MQFSKDADIAQFLEFCIQPTTKMEMDYVLSTFWKKLERFSGEEVFCELDIACMHAFDYAYKGNSTCISQVTRSLYANCFQIEMAYEENYRKHFMNCSDNCFLRFLRRVDSSDEKHICFQMSSLKNGNIAYAHFLLKFGFVGFPSPASESGTKMIAGLVEMFNHSLELLINVEVADYQISLQLDELINRITRSEFSFRRFMLVFCAICIVIKYRVCEKSESRTDLIFLMINMKLQCRCMITCLDLFLKSTTESKITFADIGIFTATVLNPQFGAEFGRILVETSRKIVWDVEEFFNPRSLKDLARCKIRACVPSSILLTEQVNRFPLPVPLKEFILFDNKEFWNLLTVHHRNLHFFQKCFMNFP